MLALLLTVTVVAAQAQDRARTEAVTRRVNDRILSLQREADRLASEARTLVGDLRKLEIDRDLQVEQLNQAEAGVATGQTEVTKLNERVAALEQQRLQQLP